MAWFPIFKLIWNIFAVVFTGIALSRSRLGPTPRERQEKLALFKRVAAVLRGAKRSRYVFKLVAFVDSVFTLAYGRTGGKRFFIVSVITSSVAVGTALFLSVGTRMPEVRAGRAIVDEIVRHEARNASAATPAVLARARAARCYMNDGGGVDCEPLHHDPMSKTIRTELAELDARLAKRIATRPGHEDAALAHLLWGTRIQPGVTWVALFALFAFSALADFAGLWLARRAIASVVAQPSLASVVLALLLSLFGALCLALGSLLVHGGLMSGAVWTYVGVLLVPVSSVGGIALAFLVLSHLLEIAKARRIPRDHEDLPGCIMAFVYVGMPLCGLLACVGVTAALLRVMAMPQVPNLRFLDGTVNWLPFMLSGTAGWPAFAIAITMALGASSWLLSNGLRIGARRVVRASFRAGATPFAVAVLIITALVNVVSDAREVFP